MPITLSELKERILQTYDPDDVLFALELSTSDLLDRFEDKLEERRYQFKDLEEDDGDT